MSKPIFSAITITKRVGVNGNVFWSAKSKMGRRWFPGNQSSNNDDKYAYELCLEYAKLIGWQDYEWRGGVLPSAELSYCFVATPKTQSTE